MSEKTPHPERKITEEEFIEAEKAGDYDLANRFIEQLPKAEKNSREEVLQLLHMANLYERADDQKHALMYCDGALNTAKQGNYSDLIETATAAVQRHETAQAAELAAIEQDRELVSELRRKVVELFAAQDPKRSGTGYLYVQVEVGDTIARIFDMPDGSTQRVMIEFTTVKDMAATLVTINEREGVLFKSSIVRQGSLNPQSGALRTMELTRDPQPLSDKDIQTILALFRRVPL